MCRFVQEAFQFAAGPGSLDEVDRAASRRERPSTTTTPSPNRTESPRKSRHPAGQNPPSTRPQAATDRGRRTERRNLDEHGRDQPGHRRRQEDQRTQTAPDHRHPGPVSVAIVATTSVRDTTPARSSSMNQPPLIPACPTSGPAAAAGTASSTTAPDWASTWKPCRDRGRKESSRCRSGGPSSRPLADGRSTAVRHGTTRLCPQRSRTATHWTMANKVSREPTEESTPTWRTEADMPVTSA